MDMLAWSDFQTIIAIHRAGTLSGAARLLKSHQSTVSRALQKIEAQTQQRIFFNISGRYQVTLAGMRFLDVAQKFDKAVEELSNVEFPTVSISGTVRLTSVEGFITAYLIPRLSAFRERNPAIAFELNGSNETMDLLKRGYEISLRLNREERAGSLIQKKVADIGIGIYAKANSAVSYSRSHIGTLGNWIGYETALSEIPEENWFRRKFKCANPSVRVSSYLSMEKAIEEGIGIGLLPFYLGDKNPRLQRIGAERTILTKPIWLISHPETRRQSSVNCFVKWLMVELENSKSELLGIR